MSSSHINCCTEGMCSVARQEGAGAHAARSEIRIMAGSSRKGPYGSAGPKAQQSRLYPQQDYCESKAYLVYVLAGYFRLSRGLLVQNGHLEIWLGFEAPRSQRSWTSKVPPSIPAASQNKVQIGLT